MNLRQYFHKKVRVVDIDDIEYIGEVAAFTYAKDNGDIGEDSIAIRPAHVELAESEIKSIEIIEDE
ncbi:MAG: hypothetical protein LIO40_06145 [Ruminococcus sp.]|nr:hypothetical protein [Ruminococcus sp.]